MPVDAACTPCPRSRSSARPRRYSARAASNSPFIARSCASAHDHVALTCRSLEAVGEELLALRDRLRHRRRPVQRIDGQHQAAARHQALVAGQRARARWSAPRPRSPGCSGLRCRAPAPPAARRWPARRARSRARARGISAWQTRSVSSLQSPALAAVQAHEHGQHLARRPQARVAGALGRARGLGERRVRAGEVAHADQRSRPARAAARTRRIVCLEHGHARGAAGWRRRACRRARRRAGRRSTGAAPRRCRSRGPARRAGRARAGSGAPARGGSRGSPRTRGRGRARR